MILETKTHGYRNIGHARLVRPYERHKALPRLDDPRSRRSATPRLPALQSAPGSTLAWNQTAVWPTRPGPVRAARFGRLGENARPYASWRRRSTTVRHTPGGPVHCTTVEFLGVADTLRSAHVAGERFGVFLGTEYGTETSEKIDPPGV